MTSQRFSIPRSYDLQFFLDYIEMGALPKGSEPLILLSTPHHFPEPQDERNQQASQQCGSNFEAHSKIGV